MTPKSAPSASNLEDRLRFESMLSDLSSGIVNLEPDEVDREIENAQRKVCDCLSLDLAAPWQLSLLHNSESGHSGLPFLRDIWPARAPALQWTSALCSAGAPAGVKTTAAGFSENCGFAGGSG